ncbi:MAG: type II toxin-antitoxin system RelE/ParE family toxin [Candidatus Aminicenantes bacterium]|jgi:mRNA interferase RelE/StbE
MEKYKIFIKKSAADELSKIPKKSITKIVERLQSLALNPRPSGCHKLSVRNLYRIRYGDYRIVYLIKDETSEVHIIKIGHRREIYR